MTARIRMLCHGATAATHMHAFPLDPPVEAAELARVAAMAGIRGRFDRILTGPARAARETAVALGLSAGVEMALADLDCGRWRGLALTDVAGTEPEAVSAWLTNPQAAPHGGESIAALIARIGAWLDAAAGAGRVLAITHAAVMRAAAVRVLGAPETSFWAIDAGPLTAIEFSHDGRRWRLRCPAL